MGNDIKTGVGYLIPVAAIAGFFLSLFAENFMLAIIFAITGILGWVLYSFIMESTLPENAGRLIILFGILMSIAVFLHFGLEQNMFGGYVIQEEGALFGLMVLLFVVLAGLLFNKKDPSAADPGLSPKEKEWVQTAVNQVDKEGKDPKIIVIKQEPAASKEEDVEEDYEDYSQPMYAYPPEFYEDEDEWEDEDDDEEDEDE